MLDAARLVTLVGAPGCGKSRLAVELAGRSASRFAGGVGVVELAPLADPARTASVVGAELGIGDRPDRSTVATLVDVLADEELLLVLDNCEHVVAAARTPASTASATPIHERRHLNNVIRAPGAVHVRTT